MRAAITGLLINIALVAAKLLAGIGGDSYSLDANAVESATETFSSVIVWAGLQITAQPAHDDSFYG
jgi:divalent metal cation (Fe/Co/Zn/Cd) transporter